MIHLKLRAACPEISAQAAFLYAFISAPVIPIGRGSRPRSGTVRVRIPPGVLCGMTAALPLAGAP